MAGWRAKGGGVEGEGWRGGGWRVGGWGWWGGQGLDLKMEIDQDWSPATRLQGRAGSLVVDK